MIGRIYKFTNLVIIYLVLTLVALWFVIPVLGGVVTAFKPPAIALTSPPVWTFTPTLENLHKVLFEEGQVRNLFNSLIVATSSVLLSVVIGTPAAYALARLPMRGAKNVLSWFISLRMLPPVLVALPFFVLAQTFHVYDTQFGLILAYLPLCIPFVIWLMRGYFVDIPRELEESAMVDGCTQFEAMRRVLLPVARPGFIATILLVFILAWNEYFLALILVGGRAATMPVVASTFIMMTRIAWSELFAADLVIVVPVIILILAVQRHLVRGLTFGMVK
jgi:multiple sugar transport system permease protein